MDILQWILTSLQINASELVVNELNLRLNLELNSILFLVYVVVSIIIKRAAFLAAFFMSCLLFDAAIFDPLSEASLYALTFAMYSYVIFCKGLTLQTKVACGIVIALAVLLGYDAYFYGIDGYYGESKTFIYNNIEYIALYAHTILISTLIDYRRIRNSFGRFAYSVLCFSRNSAYFIPV